MIDFHQVRLEFECGDLQIFNEISDVVVTCGSHHKVR